MQIADPLLLQLASSNPGKLREFSEAAAEIDARVEQVSGLGDLSPCEEDGKTFAANARKKALYYAAHSAGLVFADDSGLCVDALGGAPGVYSARFSGPGATDETNNRKLIEKLAPLPAGVRTRIAAPPFSGFAAHYVCVIALAHGTRILATTEGSVEGIIIDEPRGDNGFGYDPYFFYPQRGKTFAELAASEKFAVSHRGIAFRKMLATLRPGPQGSMPSSSES